MRVLITGGSGFVGRHLAAACAQAGEHVVTASRSSGTDLADASAAAELIARAEPEVVYHLAAQAHVGLSWQRPVDTLRLNLDLTVNVLEAARRHAPEAVVVAVSSGEVYGRPERLPLTERSLPRPQNPYAVSKAATDLLAAFYADAHGLAVVRARAFNHAGPGQEPVYAIASFARQVAAGIERGDDPLRVVTGNPDTRRDYTDVRDVVRAYRLLARTRFAGRVFNVCSGQPRSAAELVAALGAVAGVAVDHAVDPALLRPHEVMEVRGDASELKAATGWEPEIPLERTLADTVAWWRGELRAGRAEDRPLHE